MELNAKRVLVLSPHTDDGELGCGGTISKLVRQGAEVHYAAFSAAEQSVPVGFPRDVLRTEVKAATQALGIPIERLTVHSYEVRKLSYSRQEVLEDLVRLKKQIEPDLVFMPSLGDIHQDHLTVAQEGLRAFKTTTIFSYELIWNNLSFSTTGFVRLQDVDVHAKWNALQAYRSQSGRPYMSKDFVFSLATTRGTQIGCSYAEAFEVVRFVV